MNTFPDSSQPPPPAPPSPIAGHPSSAFPSASRDLVWDGVDVLRVVLMGVVSFVLGVFAVLMVVSGSSLRERLGHLASVPELGIVAQMFAWILWLGYMYTLITRERRSSTFWKTIYWNWPMTVWPYLVIGVLLQGVVLILSLYLRFPKETPFEILLRRPGALIMITAFSVTLGPLVEELFFRGFFLPVLARRFGALAGVSVTAVCFGLVHAPQYGYSWASVLLITLVGLVLGSVRAMKNSVAAGFVVHATYNATSAILLLIAAVR